MKIIRKILRIFTRKWVVIPIAVLAVIGLTLGLSLGLTLTVKSVEVEGEVILLCGETYTSGFTIKQTTRAGLVHREPVTKKMLSGLDTSTSGDKKVTVRYNGRTLHPHVTVLAKEDVSLQLSGALPAEYEPNAPFATTAVFDVYYEGNIIRSAPVRTSCAPDFTTSLSGEYQINLYYTDQLYLPYDYSVAERIDEVVAAGRIFIKEGATLSKDSIFGNATFTVYYSDGRAPQTVMLYEEEVELLRLEDAEGGGKLAVLRYGGVEVECPVSFYSGESVLEVERLYLSLNKRVYLVGESFDPKTAFLRVWYVGWSGDTYVEVTPQMVEIDPFDDEGDYTLKVHYKERTITSVIKVVSPEVSEVITDISTTWKGTQNGEPKKGDPLDFTGAKLTVTYGNGYHTKEVDLTEEMVSGYDPDKAGPQTLTLTYEGFKASLDICVLDPTSNEVTAINSIVNWNKNTLLSSDEIVIPEDAYLDAVIGYGASHKSIPLTNEKVKITGFTPHILDPQEITITYDEKFAIVMHDFVVVDDSTPAISYISAEDPFMINVGDDFDFDDVILTLHYNNNTSEEKTFAEMREDGAILQGSYDVNVVDSYYLKVFYKDCWSSFIWVIVEGEEPVHGVAIEVEVQDGGAVFKKDQAFDLSQITVYLVDNEGGRTDITNQLSPISNVDGFSSAQIGDNLSATVLYVDEDGKQYTASFSYRVIA